MERKPYTIDFQRKLAIACRVAMDIVANGGSSTAQRHVWDALAECEREERAHRRMGARFTRGAARYRISSHDSASIMMARSFFCEAPGRSTDLEDLAGLRSDHLHMVFARALTSEATLARAVTRFRDWPGALGESDPFASLAAWDYAHDCAGGV